MATPIKRSEMESEVEYMQQVAQMLGLLEPGWRLVYIPGNTRNGISARIDVTDAENNPQHVGWLPEFHYTEPKTTQWRIITTTNRVLNGMRRVQEATNGK